MNKDKLKKLIREVVLSESIDIYDLNKLKDSTNYQIKKEDKENFQVIFSPKKSPNKYQFKVSKLGDTYNIIFGVIINGVVSTTKFVKDEFTMSVLSTVFSLLRYYIDKYKIGKLYFGADIDIRSGIYKSYINKHFSDYELLPLETTNNI